MVNTDMVLQRVGELVGATPVELLDRLNYEPNIVHGRQLAAYLLSELRADKDWGWVVLKLDCTVALVKHSHERMKDRRFRADVRKLQQRLGVAVEEDPAEDPALKQDAAQNPDEKEPDDGGLGELLFRIAREHFGYDEDTLRASKRHEAAVARRILMYIASNAFSKSRSEIAGLFRCTTVSVGNGLNEIKYDIEHDDTTKELFREICEEYDLKFLSDACAPT